MSGLEDLGRSYISFVRDSVISGILHRNPEPSEAQTLQLAAVDNTLHHMLWWLEQPDCPVRLITKTGANVAEISDGLPSELYGDNSWIAKYSEYERDG